MPYIEYCWTRTCRLSSLALLLAGMQSVVEYYCCNWCYILLEYCWLYSWLVYIADEVHCICWLYLLILNLLAANLSAYMFFPLLYISIMAEYKGGWGNTYRDCGSMSFHSHDLSARGWVLVAIRVLLENILIIIEPITCWPMLGVLWQTFLTYSSCLFVWYY